jgi:hypothetical protein
MPAAAAAAAALDWGLAATGAAGLPPGNSPCYCDDHDSYPAWGRSAVNLNWQLESKVAQGHTAEELACQCQTSESSQL